MQGLGCGWGLRVQEEADAGLPCPRPSWGGRQTLSRLDCRRRELTAQVKHREEARPARGAELRSSAAAMGPSQAVCGGALHAGGVTSASGGGCPHGASPQVLRVWQVPLPPTHHVLSVQLGGHRLQSFLSRSSREEVFSDPARPKWFVFYSTYFILLLNIKSY